MPQMTKTQMRTLAKSILDKSAKLTFTHRVKPAQQSGGYSGVMSVKDFEAIQKIYDRMMKRIDG